MLIDWFIVIAQVINFLILVWLLKHFLYIPILNAIDARENKVADELANAKAKETEAQKEKEEFKHNNEEFDKQRAALLNKAKDDAKAERQRLFEEAWKEASDLRAKQQEALKNDKQKFNKEISRRAQKEVFAIARKALKDLTGTSLEERTIDVFAQKLRDIRGEEKEQLTSALSLSKDPVVVHTAFDLPQAQRDLIRKTIKESLGIKIRARFETAPNLISGIELTTDGQKVAWSIANYLTSLERSIDEVLQEQPKGESKTGPELKSNESKSKNEPEVKTKSESESDKSKPTKESETNQEPENNQESETKSESVAKE